MTNESKLGRISKKKKKKKMSNLYSNTFYFAIKGIWLYILFHDANKPIIVNRMLC